MRRSQVELFAKLFDLGHPGKVLKEVWGALDTVVVQRNGIAHGRLTAEQVGRDYTLSDMQAVVFLWHARWHEFLDHAERLGATRDFYRV